MAKTAVVKARIEPELKADVEHILGELGLSPTQAVTLFYHQIKQNRGLPFEIKLTGEQPSKQAEKSNYSGDKRNLYADKSIVQEQMVQFLNNLKIKDEPVGYEALQAQMRAENLDENELSQSIVTMREDD